MPQSPAHTPKNQSTGGQSTSEVKKPELQTKELSTRRRKPRGNLEGIVSTGRYSGEFGEF